MFFCAGDAAGYCIDWLARKMVVARAIENQTVDYDWRLVEKSSIQTISADANKSIEAIPAQWSAGDMSMWLNGRGDWAAFASASPCLRAEVAS